MNETSTLWCVAYEIADGFPLDADVGGEDVVPHLQRDGLWRSIKKKLTFMFSSPGMVSVNNPCYPTRCV
jgi:hypothetical protein